MMCRCIQAQRAFTVREDISNRIFVVSAEIRRMREWEKKHIRNQPMLDAVIAVITKEEKSLSFLNCFTSLPHERIDDGECQETPKW
jgi:hypothetical protein